MAPFLRFLLGDDSLDVLQAIRADGLRWAMQERDRAMPLNRMMGLGGPRLVRADLRRHHLVQALRLMDAPTSWGRRKQLAEAARVFEARRWPIWGKLDTPPPHASEVDCHLWNARQYGALATAPHTYLELGE